MDARYNPNEIDAKWQAAWTEQHVDRTPDLDGDTDQPTHPKTPAAPRQTLHRVCDPPPGVGCFSTRVRRAGGRRF